MPIDAASRHPHAVVFGRCVHRPASVLACSPGQASLTRVAYKLGMQDAQPLQLVSMQQFALRTQATIVTDKHCICSIFSPSQTAFAFVDKAPTPAPKASPKASPAVTPAPTYVPKLSEWQGTCTAASSCCGWLYCMCRMCCSSSLQTIQTEASAA